MNALDTNTFVIVFASTLAVIGIVIWLTVRAENKKRP